jgi:hypothetical protein
LRMQNSRTYLQCVLLVYVKRCRKILAVAVSNSD